MKSGRSLIIYVILLSIVPLTGHAAGLIDPFYEQFIVGHYADAGDIQTDIDGWPSDLFARPLVEATANEYWPQLVAAYALQDFRCLGWRFSADDSSRLIAIGESPLTVLELLKQGILELETAGDYPAALERLDELMNRIRPEAPASELFVWSLRRRALINRIREPVPSEAFWPELLTLGAFDKHSGWALWRVHRGATHRILLPEAACTRQSALWLMGVRETGITPRDLDGSAFPADLKASLGGKIFDEADLRRHYGLYPQPPIDSLLQDAWLTGKWRLGGHSSQQALKLAELPGVALTHQAQYRRRAGERLVMAGAWQAGHDALHNAWTLAGQDGARDVRERVRIEIERAATLARHVDAAGWAERFDHIAPRFEANEIDPRLSSQAEIVDQGKVPDIDGRHQPQRPAQIQETLRQESLAIWAKWGLDLFEGESGRQRAYHMALRKVLHAAPASRTDAAALAIGPVLLNSGNADPLADWMLWQDLAIICSYQVPAMKSPIPEQLVFGDTRQTVDVLKNHGLLGLAILYGDGRGQMAAVQALPAGGLSRDEYLILMYPVPHSMGLTAAIARAGLEPELVLALIRNESRFDPGARSRAGALGWMQIMPFHFPDRGFTAGQAVWRHPDDALQKGLAIIRENMRRYGNDPYRVLAAFNAGPTAVNRWDQQLGGDVDRATFLSWIGYPETRAYVRKVLIDRQVYAWLFSAIGNDPVPGASP